MPQALLKALSKVDLIVHAGDIVALDVIRGLETLAPVKAVRGNMDLPEVWTTLPEKDLIVIEGKKLGIVHSSGSGWMVEERILPLFPGVDAIIFGHTHEPMNKVMDGVLLFNPGKASDSYGVIEIGEDIKGRIKRNYF
jgi:putative phosphoesterase